MALTERCFGFDSGGLESRMPHCFDDEYPERHAIIKVDGDVASHVVCIPVELRAGNARSACAGIAGVATHPDHRGNGYMHRLLEFWLGRLDDRGVPLAELEGDRVRYGRYGWENAGREERYRITERSFAAGRRENASAAEVIRRFRGATDIELIREIHETERYRVSRDRRRYERLLEQTGLETLVYDATRPAYLCYRGDDPASVLEFGGSREGVAALLKRVLGAAGEVAVYTHPSHPLTALFHDVAADWERHPHRKLNILDLPATLAAYQPLLDERWSKIVDTFGNTSGEITLRMTGLADRSSDRDASTGTVTVAYDASGVSVDRTDREPDVALDRRRMVDFLFGSRNARHAIGRARPFLDAVLPLDYYFWQTETI